MSIIMIDIVRLMYYDKNGSLSRLSQQNPKGVDMWWFKEVKTVHMEMAMRSGKLVVESHSALEAHIEMARIESQWTQDGEEYSYTVNILHGPYFEKSEAETAPHIWPSQPHERCSKILKLPHYVFEYCGNAVMRVAQEIQDGKSFENLPILGDALQEAGYSCEQVLAHCRDVEYVHQNGCWVIDLILMYFDPDL